MTSEAASAHLRSVLEQNTEKVRKPKSAVLFRRGDKASGMFVILSGRVSLDLGVDSLLARSYGVGTLVGPAVNHHAANLQHDGYGVRRRLCFNFLVPIVNSSLIRLSQESARGLSIVSG